MGYVGPGSAIDVLLGGLKRQEYRGYDSAGVAIIDDAGRLETRKRAGKLAVLLGDLADSAMDDGHTGIVEAAGERPILNDELDLETRQQDFVEHPDDQLVLTDS